MAGEFTKPSSLIAAKVGQLAKADDYNKNLALISKDSFIPVDADGLPADGDLGDETIGTNGTLIEDMKVRTGKALKIYDASGNLLNTANWSNLITSSSYIDKYSIYGLIPSSNSGTPDEKVDVTSGKCIATDFSTILSLSTTTTADLTNHITPTNDTTYHLFLYRNASTGLDIVDFTTSLTPTAGTGDAQLPNLDVGKYRRILSVLTIASGDIIPFKGYGLNGGAIKILYDNLVIELPNLVTVSNSPISVPQGILCHANLIIFKGENVNGTTHIITDLKEQIELSCKFHTGCWDQFNNIKAEVLTNGLYSISTTGDTRGGIKLNGYTDERTN